MKLNLDLIYPVGAIYITTSEVSPQTIFGGTWEQITSDAYLKIVSNNAGTLGGTSSDHKIPVSSMPSHRHTDLFNYNNYIIGTGTGQGSGYNISLGSGFNYGSIHIGNTGGGQAYYPYYYGVYVWKRIG